MVMIPMVILYCDNCNFRDMEVSFSFWAGTWAAFMVVLIFFVDHHVSALKASVKLSLVAPESFSKNQWRDHQTAE